MRKHDFGRVFIIFRDWVSLEIGYIQYTLKIKTECEIISYLLEKEGDDPFQAVLKENAGEEKSQSKINKN